MSQAWISEPNMFQSEMLCESLGYCEPQFCKLICECFYTEDKRVECPFCGKKLPSITYLRQHCHYYHLDVRKCPVCKWKGKSLSKHCFQQWRLRNDNYHATIYYLIAIPDGHKRKLLRKAREIAQCVLANNLLKKF